MAFAQCTKEPKEDVVFLWPWVGGKAIVAPTQPGVKDFKVHLKCVHTGRNYGNATVTQLALESSVCVDSGTDGGDGRLLASSTCKFINSSSMALHGKYPQPSFIGERNPTMSLKCRRVQGTQQSSCPQEKKIRAPLNKRSFLIEVRDIVMSYLALIQENTGKYLASSSPRSFELHRNGLIPVKSLQYKLHASVIFYTTVAPDDESNHHLPCSDVCGDLGELVLVKYGGPSGFSLFDCSKHREVETPVHLRKSPRYQPSKRAL
ncbi:hypothetical protein EGR_04992 [Echinococcus granulosus]|uniref:Uncharacterized protein n=1 Tax=Echinococcus granulosus TaxID=6210 RepID=W6V2H9_ECHGR|nr:hypothetical protein EGR_04992 [Echinococcus granulosus]EUB60139.1 hypothetical protein EGR_04992 [Echinococcus granulosus]